MYEKLNILAERISSVTGAELPEKIDQVKESEPSTTIGKRVRNQRTRIDDLARAVYSLTERIQL